jgi:hypothetical protein
VAVEHTRVDLLSWRFALDAEVGSGIGRRLKLLPTRYMQSAIGMGRMGTVFGVMSPPSRLSDQQQPK